MFRKIVKNYYKDLKAGRRIEDWEIVDLLVNTVAYLTDDKKKLGSSKGYIVYLYNQTASNLAKGGLPVNKNTSRLDLAISAAMDYLMLQKLVPITKDRMLFGSRLRAAIRMLSLLAALPDEKNSRDLSNELITALALWLSSLVEDETVYVDSRLRAAETED